MYIRRAAGSKGEEAPSAADLRDENSEARKVIKELLAIAAIPLALLLAIFGFLGVKSVSDLKQSITDGARRQTEAEVLRMQGEIRKRLDEQFKAESLQQLVRSAAKDAAATAAAPMIMRPSASPR